MIDPGEPFSPEGTYCWSAQVLTPPTLPVQTMCKQSNLDTPGCPGSPSIPVTPASPGNPGGPGSPIPGGPIGPLCPVSPLGPVSPVWPLSPFGPGGPFKAANYDVIKRNENVILVPL